MKRQGQSGLIVCGGRNARDAFVVVVDAFSFVHSAFFENERVAFVSMCFSVVVAAAAVLGAGVPIRTVAICVVGRSSSGPTDNIQRQCKKRRRMEGERERRDGDRRGGGGQG